jgi:anaerobic selenocysteine-containing dehydrogenase
MNERDMDRLGLKENQPVTVKSEIGRLENVKVRPFDLKTGNLMMYYPEANVLIPQASDQKSRTPAFKSVPVSVFPES